MGESGERERKIEWERVGESWEREGKIEWERGGGKRKKDIDSIRELCTYSGLTAKLL